MEDRSAGGVGWGADSDRQHLHHPASHHPYGGQQPEQTPGGILLNINTPTGPQLLVQPLGDAQEGHMLMSTDQVSALFASNPSGVDMALTVIAAGF